MIICGGGMSLSVWKVSVKPALWDKAADKSIIEFSITALSAENQTIKHLKYSI